ncbi:MAG: branched-chain amino acid ABC transporter permease [Thermoleophilia bacterium]|nr:branched-chain amino acid ABC transporter permease [Thermoleophilia bacterium]
MHEFLTIIAGALTTGAIYAPTALALTLVFNVTGILNLAQGEFYVIAPFVSLYVMKAWGLSVGWSSVIGVITVVGVAGLVYLLALAPLRKTTEENLIVITLALAFVLSGAGLLLFGPDPRFVPTFTGLDPIKLLGVPVSKQSLWVVGATFVLLVVVWLFFIRTRYGIAMRAASDNLKAAQYLGLDARRMGMLAFMMGGLLGGVSGVISTPLTLLDVAMGLGILLKAFIAAVIGGWGSYLGAVVGAFTLGLAQVVSATYLPTLYGDAFTLGLLLVILFLRPSGMIPSRVARTA